MRVFLIGLLAVFSLCCGGTLSAAQYGGRDAEYWVAQLEEDNPITLLKAVTAVEALAPESADAVPRLGQYLSHSDFRVRVAAVRALAAMGPQAKSYLSRLREMTTVDDVARRTFGDRSLAAESARAVWLISGDGGEPIFVLRKLRGHRPARDVIRDLAEHFGPNENPLMPLLVESLEPNAYSKGSDYDNAIADALLSLGPTTLPHLKPLLQREFDNIDNAFRGQFFELLALLKRFGPDAEVLLPELVEFARRVNARPHLIPQLEEVFIGIGAPALPTLKEMLRDKQPLVRLMALHVVGDMPSLKASLVAPVADCLESPKASVLAEALRLLGRQGQPATPYASKIRALTKHDDELVRVLAYEAVWRIDGDAADVAPCLLTIAETMQDHRGAADEIARILSEMGEPGRRAALKMKPLLRSKSDVQCRCAIRALTQTAPGEAVAALTECFADDDPMIVRRALDGSANGAIFRGHEGRAAAALLPLTDSKDLAIREKAVALYLALAVDPAPVASVVLQEFDSNLPDVKVDVLKRVGQLGTSAAPAVPKLRELLCSEAVNDSYRRKVMQTLGEIGPAAIAAIPAVGEIARTTKSGYTRVIACRCLSQFGRAAIPEIVRVLEAHGDSPRLRKSLPRNLAHGFRERGAESVPALTEALEHNSPLVRRWAVMSLGAVGPDADPALGALVEIGGRAEPEEAAEIASSIWRISDDKELAVPFAARAIDAKPQLLRSLYYSMTSLESDGLALAPVLRKVLNSSDSGLQSSAAQLLAKFNDRDAATIGRLRELAAYAHYASIEALAELDADTAKTRKLLEQWSHDREPRTRATAVRGLGYAGVTCLPRVREALVDRSPIVQFGALDALEQMGKDGLAARSDVERLAQRQFQHAPGRKARELLDKWNQPEDAQ